MQQTNLGLRSRLVLAMAFAAMMPVSGKAEAPLSAIDWLSESVATPAPAAVAKAPNEPPVTKGAVPDDVIVSVIGARSLDGAGLLSPEVTGLPRAVWGLTPTDQVVARISQERTDGMPALESLLLTLLLAEADPPPDAGSKGRLLLARIDKLLVMGALEQAASLMAMISNPSPEMFRRSFDVALLTGIEDGSCDQMQSMPSLAPTLSARIFCLARNGDWSAANLTLGSAKALDQVTPEQDALLSRFLDAELAEETPPLAPPERMTPLDWRIYEAIGETYPTTTLPIAFAHAELRDTAGWKAQLDAAERLARAGVIDPDRLLALYTERRAAASGGVWDRVNAFQKLDTALNSGDSTAVAKALTVATANMAEVQLEVPFAEMVQDRLDQFSLSGSAAVEAFHIGLLSPNFVDVAQAYQPTTDADAFLKALATGQSIGISAPGSIGRAIAAGFNDPELSPDVAIIVAENRVGEAILFAIDSITTGLETDLSGVTEGLALLRRVGMEGTARRTALQLMLLERRG